MIHRTISGIHSFIIKRGLFIRVDPVNNTFVKIKASRVVSYLDQGFVNILDVAKENVLETLYFSDYGGRWACTKEEFHASII